MAGNTHGLLTVSLHTIMFLNLIYRIMCLSLTRDIGRLFLTSLNPDLPVVDQDAYARTVQLAAGMSGIRLSFLRRRRPFISVSGGAVHSRKSSLSSRTVLNATEDCRKKLTFSISGSSSLVSSLCSANQIRRQVAKVAWYLPCALTVGS